MTIIIICGYKKRGWVTAALSRKRLSPSRQVQILFFEVLFKQHLRLSSEKKRTGLSPLLLYYWSLIVRLTRPITPYNQEGRAKKSEKL